MQECLIYIAKSSGILTIFYSVYFFLLRKDTFFNINRYFLFIGIFASLTLPLLEFSRTIFIESHNYQILQINPIKTIPTRPSTPIINLWLIGFIIYIIGVVFFLIRFGIELLSLKNLLFKEKHILNQGIYFINTSKEIAPFSFFNIIVYNPSLHTKSELEMILKHEKVHVKQHHTIDVITIHLFSIFQWVNPLVWKYKKVLQENLEFIADQKAVHKTSSKKDYQIALVKTSLNNFSNVTNNFYQSLIQKRIVMLNKQASKSRNSWKTLVTLPLLSIFLLGFNTKEIKQLKEEQHPVIVTSNSFQKEYVSTPNTTKSTIKIAIGKESSEKELKKIKRIFKEEYNVSVKFSEIERNASGEIVGIKIDISSKGSSANYSVNDNEPIGLVVISYNSKNDKININQANNDFKYISKNDNENKIIEIHPANKDHKIIFSNEKEGEQEVIIHSEDDNIFKINTKDNKTFAYISGDPNKEPLIYIDGKKVTKKEMEKLNSDKIKSVNVYKGEKAIKKYGKKAKRGVIEIITKKD